MNFHKFTVCLLSIFLTATATAGLITQSGARLFTSAGGGDPEPGAGVFFEPDVDNAANVAAIFTHDRNCFGTGGVETWGSATLISDTSRPGHTKSVRITYPAGTDEAGCELKPEPFTETTSLFVRTYVKFSSGWEGNWPLALKTLRVFSRDDWTTGPENDGWAYISEKLVANQFGMGVDDDEVAHGYNNAVYNLDLWDPYPEVNFGNGLPYIRTGHWYKWERWYVFNSALNAEDGIMQVWIDDQLVVDLHDVTYLSDEHNATDNPENGTGWQSIWFGGNYTGSSFGATVPELHRDEQGYYLSTTLDR